jgi:hypothetical protein
LSRIEINVAGSPIASTSDAAIANWTCGLRLHGTRLRKSASPSKRCIAASIAASRAICRGGGGSGKVADSLSGGISENS